MTSGVRNVFINADPAQSVELGISMRKGTVNDVVHSQIFDKHRQQVKDNLQEIMLQTNHRTHHENLSLGKAIRSILARSFKLPNSSEHSLIHGRLPQLLRIKKISDLANKNIFKGGNVVFLAPDEKVQDLRTEFHNLGIENDLFRKVFHLNSCIQYDLVACNCLSVFDCLYSLMTNKIVMFASLHLFNLVKRQCPRSQGPRV